MRPQDAASAKHERGPRLPAVSLHGGVIPGKLSSVPGWDDDDWVGEPPEGRHTRDRAKPEFWRGRWPLAGAGLVIVVLVLVIVLVTR